MVVGLVVSKLLSCSYGERLAGVSLPPATVQMSRPRMKCAFFVTPVRDCFDERLILHNMGAGRDGSRLAMGL